MPKGVDPAAWARFFNFVVRGGGASDHPARAEEHWNTVAAGRPLRDIEYVLTLQQHHRETIIPFLIDHCGLAGKRVVEFGAGTGGLAVAMAQAGVAEVDAVEPISANAQTGVSRVQAFGLEDRIRFHHVEDTSRLPFAASRFDACVCSSVLQYVPDVRTRAKLLEEMWRVVRPGGVLAICQSGNALMPGGPHSTAWWSNLAPDRAARAGHTRGVAYWELARVLRPLGCTLLRPRRRGDSELARWRKRTAKGRLRPRGRVVHGALLGVYATIEGIVGGACGLPVAVAMPYLNVAFVKSLGRPA